MHPISVETPADAQIRSYPLRSGSRFTTARQRVPTLRIRSMVRGMAEKGGEGQSNGHSLRGRSGGGVRAPRRGRAVPERVWGTAGEVRTGTAPGEDADDRVGTKRRKGSRGGGKGNRRASRFW